MWEGGILSFYYCLPNFQTFHRPCFILKIFQLFQSEFSQRSRDGNRIPLTEASLVYLFTDSWHWFLWGYFSWTRWHGNTSSRITLDAYCSLYVLRFKVPRAELVTQWLEAIIFKCRFETTDLRREAHLELDCSRLLSLASASVFTVGSNYRNPPQMRFLKNIVKLTLVIVFAAVWQKFWILDRKRKLSGSIFLNLLGKN